MGRTVRLTSSGVRWYGPYSTGIRTDSTVRTVEYVGTDLFFVLDKTIRFRPYGIYLYACRQKFLLNSKSPQNWYGGVRDYQICPQTGMGVSEITRYVRKLVWGCPRLPDTSANWYEGVRDYQIRPQKRLKPSLNKTLRLG